MAANARKIALLAHRYVGLASALFLLVAGLTGSLLVFHHELDVALAPHLYRVTSRATALDPFTLQELALKLVPAGARLNILPLDTPRGEAINFWVDLPGVMKEADTEYFLDPSTGALNGTRRWGDPRQGVHAWMPFVYYLHYSLALGKVGKLIMGVVALLWTLDCFVGAYLTFPLASKKRSRGWLPRWRHAWLVRTGNLFSLLFSWHRASGLWVWAMLLVFAWSAVGLNLHDVYRPVMHAVYGADREYHLPKLPAPLVQPALSFRQAHAEARRLLQQEAAARGVQIYAERMMRYMPAGGRYEYRVYSSRDVSQRYATTTLWLDANTGAVQDVMFPTGDSAHGTVTTWINQLHFGTVAVGGLPYRIFVTLMGIGVVLLSVSGVWIWWRKRARNL